MKKREFKIGDKVRLLGTKSDGANWDEWNAWHKLKLKAGMVLTIGLIYGNRYYFSELGYSGVFNENDFVGGEDYQKKLE